MESVSGEASDSSEVTQKNKNSTKVTLKKENKTDEKQQQHVNKSRSSEKQDDEIDKSIKVNQAILKDEKITKRTKSSEAPVTDKSSTATASSRNKSNNKHDEEKTVLVSKQETTTTKISPLPELTTTTPNAPLIPVDILSPPKSESQTDETNTASTSPASEATMSPKLEIVEDNSSAAEAENKLKTNPNQVPMKNDSDALETTTKPSNSKSKSSQQSKKPSVANGTIPKTGGKPLLSTINKKMNKPTRKRKPKALVELYESEISHNKAGIKLCIKKSDLSSSLVSVPTKASSGASAAKSRKRSRKPKTKVDSEESEFETTPKKDRSNTNNNEQIGRSKKASTSSATAENANEAGTTCVDQSVWGSRLPEEVLYKIFQEVVGKECIPTLFRLGRVCSLWRRVSLRPSLWKSLDLSNWIKEKYRTEVKLKWFIDNRCSGCTELNISNWKITNTECVLQKLSVGCPNLESINLTGCKGFTCDHLAYLIENMKKLQRLDLSSINSEMNSNKTAVGLQALRNALEGLNGRLTHLYLAHNRLPGIPQIIECLAANCPNLVLLDLSNVFTLAASHAVLHVEKLQHGCPKLKVLRVTNSRMSLNVSTMQEMMDSPGFPNLEELSVAAQSGEESRVIGDEHLQRILKTSSKLKLLDVRGCMRLTHESLIRLPAWDIKHLFLSGCSVTRDFSSRLELIASKWAHSLIELDLAWTNVQQPLDNALRVIAEKGIESPLAHLNLCGSSVSEEAVKDILANCAYMSSINLASCRGLPRGVKRLIQGPEELRELRETLKVQMKVKLPFKASSADGEAAGAIGDAAVETKKPTTAGDKGGGGVGNSEI